MTFDLTAFLPRAVMQGIPLLYGSTGEILTEKSGNLNLGIPDRKSTRLNSSHPK